MSNGWPYFEWSRLVGVTPGLESLEEEDADPAIALHCIMHQHQLCGTCMNFEHVTPVEEGTAFSADEYVSVLGERFADFMAHCDTFQIYADPFSADVESLQHELIDLQCNSELKAKFREAQGKAEKIGMFESFQSCNVPFWKYICV